MEDYNDKVISDIMDYVIQTAIEEYKKGINIVTTGIFTKKRTININIKGVCALQSERNSFYKTKSDFFKTSITADEEFTTQLVRICKNKGIEVLDFRRDMNPRFVFRVPLEFIEPVVQSQEADLEEFRQAIKSRRHDIVEKLSECVAMNEGKFGCGVFICASGLEGNIDWEVSVPLLPFSDLGLVPLDQNEKIICLAEAVAEDLSATGAGEYTIEQNNCGRFVVAIRKKKPPVETRNEKLSEW